MHEFKLSSSASVFSGWSLSNEEINLFRVTFYLLYFELSTDFGIETKTMACVGTNFGI